MHPSASIFTLPLLAVAAATSLHAELTAGFEGGGATDTRVDRLPAILVKAGEPATPFLAPGAFTTTWTGKLVTKERLRVVFSFEGEGVASLKLNGEEILTEEGVLGTARSERIRLNRGEHDIVITFRSKDDGSGRFRLFWEERSFPRQSVPPTAFSAVDTPDPVRAGRLLFAENHCSKCHLPKDLIGPTGMPELSELGPLLFATGSRLNEAWIARWISDPSALRPDTRMPALVDASTPEGKQQAADLAAWLMTMKVGETPAAPDFALAQKGGEHYHRLGCAACHSGPDQIALDTENKRIPLSHVAEKFQPGALPDFLKNPSAHYPHIGMPNFGLSDQEAKEIAAYLLKTSSERDKASEKIPEFPKGDAARGATLANSLHCGSCHAGSGSPDFTVPDLKAIFAADASAKGCVSASPSGKTPKLALSDGERANLVAFLKKGPESLNRHVPAEYAQAKIHSLRCDSCHSIDGKASVLDRVHVETQRLVAHVQGENEKLDQIRPHLTYVGEMLHSTYIESMLAGTAQPRPRPWLDMRMPGFTTYANSLAQGLSRLHGVEPSGPEDFKVDPELAAIGKQLASLDGFGCTTCHGVGSVKPSAAFEVEGVNFALSHSRLRKEWYSRWMDNPSSVTPGSKMPRYSENGESQRTDVLDGDAAKQFDAIWHFLQSAK